MAFWQHSPADVDDRLVELAHLFVDCRAAFFETADRFHWSPAPGSVAAHAAAELPSPDPTVADPRGETGHRLIAEVAQTYLLAASGHLGGLASLYASGEVFFPPAALIRATIENCAHAMWVLGDDPTEPSENRLARAYLEELFSAEQAKMNAGRLGAKSGPIHMQANGAYKTLKRQILARFPSVDAATLGKWTLQDQTLLGPEATVAWMYALAQKAGGSSVGDRAALGIYGFVEHDASDALPRPAAARVDRRPRRRTPCRLPATRPGLPGTPSVSGSDGVLQRSVLRDLLLRLPPVGARRPDREDRPSDADVLLVTLFPAW